MNPLLIKAAPYAAIALLAFAGKCSYDAKQREIGAMRERLRVTDSSLAIAVRNGRKVDSVFRVDTVRLTRRLETVTTLLDTLRFSDTVTLTRRESVLVFVADSLVQQCRATVQSCTALTANLRDQLRLTATQRDAYRKLLPSGFDKARSMAVPALVGAGICYLFCPRKP
jgi:hypothetical protein